MINAEDLDSIKHNLNTDVVRKLLVKYFITKGFDKSFDLLMYPSMIQDLPEAIPILASKIEVVPYAVNVDPMQCKATLGWNLFVLGTYRMFLGETTHNDLPSLARQINMGIIPVPQDGLRFARKQTTPRRVVNFIVRVLGSHVAGYVDMQTPTRSVRSIEKAYKPGFGVGNSMPSQFFARRGLY